MATGEYWSSELRRQDALYNVFYKKYLEDTDKKKAKMTCEDLNKEALKERYDKEGTGSTDKKEGKQLRSRVSEGIQGVGVSGHMHVSIREQTQG